MNNPFPCLVPHKTSKDLAENSLDMRRLFLLFPFLCEGYLFERSPLILRRLALRFPDRLSAARCLLTIIGLLSFGGCLGLDPIDDLCPLDVANEFLVLASGLGDFGAYSARPFGIFSRYLLG